MDTTVGNSFFYFFSAVPQVLAAVMALFGVFVIFKLQNLKEELVYYANNVSLLIKSISDSRDTSDIYVARSKNLAVLEQGIKYKDLYLIKDIIVNRIDRIVQERAEYVFFKKRFIFLYVLQKLLKKLTLLLSAFSGLIILLCLATIPFSDFIGHHPEFQRWWFISIIISLLICLLGFIIILSFALDENTEWKKLEEK